MATQVKMPQLGESVVEGTVVKWLRKEGERVQEFDLLLEVSTDKVATEIPSPASGTLLKILVAEGSTVQAGTLLAWIGLPGEELPDVSSPALELTTPVASGHTTPTSVTSPEGGRDRDLGFISPVVARLARENNVDLHAVTGSGEGGRITKKDVRDYLEKRQPAAETPAWETPGEGDLFRPTEMMFARSVTQAVDVSAREATSPVALQPPPPVQKAAAPQDTLVPLSPVRRAIAAHMLMSKHTSPHVTTVMEADMQAVTAHREAHKADFARNGVHLTYSAYFVAAAVAALRAYPIVNSSWSEEGILLHAGIHIGLATALGEEGLIVPVIRNADGLSLLGLGRAINDLAERARAHRLQPDEVRGGTFTLTNHGTGGSLFATPVINQPQCAILGAGAIQKRPVVINDAIAIRPMVYLSLTFDHRILDGSSADGFLGRVVDVLQNWR